VEEIYHNVWVGDDNAYVHLKDKPKWSFLRCCKYGPGGHQQTLDYHTLAAPEGSEHFVVERPRLMALNLLDLDDPNFVDPGMIQTGLDFIQQELLSGQKVLIACNAGRSRGPTVGLMWLRRVGHMRHAYLHSQRLYHSMYPLYSPSQGIDQFARSHWAALGEKGTVNGLG
jgi:hypothetical protein